MMLGGLWHGTGWNFIFWGLLHGTFLVGHRFLKALRHWQNVPFYLRGTAYASIAMMVHVFGGNRTLRNLFISIFNY